jgi:hypothetical protein
MSITNPCVTCPRSEERLSDAPCYCEDARVFERRCREDAMDEVFGPRHDEVVAHPVESYVVADDDFDIDRECARFEEERYARAELGHTPEGDERIREIAQRYDAPYVPTTARDVQDVAIDGDLDDGSFPPAERATGLGRCALCSSWTCIEHLRSDHVCPSCVRDIAESQREDFEDAMSWEERRIARIDRGEIPRICIGCAAHGAPRECRSTPARCYEQYALSRECEDDSERDFERGHDRYADGESAPATATVADDGAVTGSLDDVLAAITEAVTEHEHRYEIDVPHDLRVALVMCDDES